MPQPSESVLKQTKVDLGGLMMVLADHLYSTPAVALRELVQNAHDSCRRRQIEAPKAAFAASIRIGVDAQARTLWIEDTGAGLTADEIDRYLATVGSGYTRTLRERGEGGADLIGYFGLGFLSAFVIAERVEVWTTSYKEPELAWRFSSRSGQSYTVEVAEPRPVGTRVTLHLSPKHASFADAGAVRGLLGRYCCLLQVPIFFAGEAEAINATPPPWRDPEAHSPLRQRRLAEAFAGRFAGGLGPLCTLPIGPQGEHAVSGDSSADVRGLLWIHEATTYGTGDNRQVAVYVRGMLIDPDERDLLPRWAGFVGAVVESDRLAPTASREDLQHDAGYEAAQAAVREALIEGMATLAKREPATWRRVLTRHNEALLGAAISDPRLFSLLADELTVPTTQGDLPVATVLRRGGGKLHVSRAQRGGFEELLFRALKVPVIIGTRYGAVPFCREYVERRGRGGRVIMLGHGESESDLFEPVREVDAATRERLQQALGGPDYELILARFEPEYLPFVGVPDREVELKQRIESDEADARIGAAVLSLARSFTKQVEDRPPLRVYVNARCPAIAALLSATPALAIRAAALMRPLLALLSEADEGGRIMAVDTALETFCAAIVELLAEGEA